MKFYADLIRLFAHRKSLIEEKIPSMREDSRSKEHHLRKVSAVAIGDSTDMTAALLIEDAPKDSNARPHRFGSKF